MTGPDQWDLSGAVVDDGHAEVAMFEALRRYGARSVELGYRWDPAWGPDTGEAEPPRDVPVTWFAEAVYRLPRTGKRRTVVREWVAPVGGDHRRAAVEALAELVRERGGTVELVIR